MWVPSHPSSVNALQKPCLEREHLGRSFNLQWGESKLENGTDASRRGPDSAGGSLPGRSENSSFSVAPGTAWPLTFISSLLGPGTSWLLVAASDGSAMSPGRQAAWQTARAVSLGMAEPLITRQESTGTFHTRGRGGGAARPAKGYFFFLLLFL